jgi:hypothetical protein
MIYKNKTLMARPKKEDKDKKRTMSITVNKDLNEVLEKFAEENGLSKSEYIEYLIKKDQKK